VSAVSPVRELVKLPVPVPSVVRLSLIVGEEDVPQHTPFAVTSAPPSDVTLPPPVAVVVAMDVISVVVNVGMLTVEALEPSLFLSELQAEEANIMLKTSAITGIGLKDLFMIVTSFIYINNLIIAYVLIDGA